VRCSIATVGGMPKIARVSVQRFEIATLTFGEQDVEGEGGFSRAGNAGYNGEPATRDLDIDVL
jgi:hypothetical protein